MKKFFESNLLPIALFVRFVIPFLIIVGDDVTLIFSDPSTGLSFLGLVLMVVMLFVMNRTFKDINEGKEKWELSVYIYKQLKTFFTFGALIFLSIMISMHFDLIWVVLAVVGACFILSEHLLHKYYLLTKK